MCSSPTLNTLGAPQRVKLTWCGRIPSHAKPLLLSWILSSTLMTIQYSLQAADERPIHGSICCGPNSPDAILVRGPLQANWKTEAIAQPLGTRVCVRVTEKGCQREENNDKRWREWGRGSVEEKERHSLPHRENSWPVSICSHAAILEKPSWALN